MPSNPTLADVAAAAGVSEMTVSRALRNHPEVAPATRDRIQALAAKIGYSTDPFISRAMTRMRQRPEGRGPEPLAVVWPHALTAEDRRNPRRRRLLAGVAERARQLGFAIQEAEIDGRLLTAARLSRQLYNRGVRALLLLPAFPYPSVPLELDWTRFTAATIGFGPMSERLHRAAHDHFSGMAEAVARLRALGCKRLAALLPGDIDTFIHHRYSAAFYAHAPQGPAVAAEDIYSADTSASALATWLKRRRHDGVVFHGAPPRAALAEMKLPAVSLHWNEADPGFAGVDQMPERVAEGAIDLIFGQLNRNERGLPATARTLLLPGDWRDAA